MYVNCGLLCGYLCTYEANMACPPSFSYPAQSITCRRPDSFVRFVVAALAAAAGPATTPAPAASAARRSMSARESRRSNGSPSTSIDASFGALASVAGRTDDEQNLGGLVPRVAHAVG